MALLLTGFALAIAFPSLAHAQIGGRWWPVTAGRPSARSLHAMAYDSRRGVIVLFGGSGDGSADLGDTWEWDGHSWTEKAIAGQGGPASPSGRNEHAMCYDSARSVILLFGGLRGANPLGDTWTWDGATWTRVGAGPGPDNRFQAALACDSDRGVAVLFGGSNGFEGLADTWEWNGANWRRVAAGIPGPLARDGHAMAYDKTRRRTVLFGGHHRLVGLLDDTWQWDGMSWIRVQGPAGPSARYLHGMAFDELNARVVLFGGFDGAERDDTWELANGGWSPMMVSGPAARMGHVMTYDANRKIVALYGGTGAAGPIFYDTWALTRPPPKGLSTLENPNELRRRRVVDSGFLGNNGKKPKVVFKTEVQSAGAAWLRAFFSTIELAPGSLLRITSPDGEMQEFDRFTARMWGDTSATFVGDTIEVALVAAPGSRNNRVAVEAIGIEVGALSGCANTPCGACSPDGRVPSNEDWSGRYGAGGCTASIYNENGCFVSAGHCWVGGGSALWFRNPLSLNDCTSQPPPVDDQFPIIASNSDASPCSPDWKVGKIGVNTSGQTHFQRYAGGGNAVKPLATSFPPVAGQARIYGFGANSVPVLNSVQELTLETLNSVGAGGLSYSGGTTTGGTSGSGVVHNFTIGGDAIVGINTCCGGACSGSASWINQPAFVTARQQMCPHTVHAPWDAPFCLNDTQITVQITVCNTSAVTDSYNLSFAGLAVGPNCSVPGPTSFTVIGGNAIGPVLAGQCLNSSVIIGRPTGLTAAWLVSCYAVTATSLNSGTPVTAHGSVQDRRDLCTNIFKGGFGTATLAVGARRKLEFVVENVGVSSGVITYRAEAFGPDMEPSGAYSLDGGYYGEPSGGTVKIKQGSKKKISVEVLSRWLQSVEISDLVLSTDLDGDGRFEPLVSVGLRAIQPFSEKECKKGGWRSLTRDDGSHFDDEKDCERYAKKGQ